MKRTLAVFAVLLVGSAMLFAEGKKDAPKYPVKPVQVIVPAGAGGDTDLNCRILGKYMEKELGQPYVVVNVGGAGGTLGSRRVKDAPADGYTVLFYHPSMLLNKMMGLVDYTFSDFEMGGLAVIDETNAFVGNAKAPYNDLKEMADYMKQNPGKVTFATEVGAFTHLHALAFQDAAGVEFNIVDVGAAAAKVTALLGRQIDVIGTQYGLVKDYITKGDFKSFGILSDNRNPLFPNEKTAKEVGINVSFTKFFFYSFPKGTPKEVIDTFTAALKRVVENPEYQKEAKEKLLVRPTYMTPAATLEFLKGEEAKFMKYQDKLTAAKKK
jgi:tripartite-type tricarboxylate transporter receptor subunit TctC